jgi:flavin-dependent dehydrogenase
MEGDFDFLGKSTVMAGYEPHFTGYFWIFPKGQSIANVGVARFDMDRKCRAFHLKPALDRILKKEELDGYRIVGY